MSELTDYLNYHCIEMDYDIYSDAFDMAEAEDALVDDLSKLVMDMLTHMRADGCEGCVYKARCDNGLLDECVEVTEFTKRASRLGVDLTK